MVQGELAALASDMYMRMHFLSGFISWLLSMYSGTPKSSESSWIMLSMVSHGSASAAFSARFALMSSTPGLA